MSGARSTVLAVDLGGRGRRTAGLIILFLFSDCASWITGVTLDVAGGQIMV
jgi:hypothetical protein